jgi:hypothetical protein
MAPNGWWKHAVESFELKLPMVGILTFRACFGDIYIQQSAILIHHSIKVVEKYHLAPSQLQRRRVWLVVDVDDCAAMVAMMLSCKIHRLRSRYAPNIT